MFDRWLDPESDSAMATTPLIGALQKSYETPKPNKPEEMLTDEFVRPTVLVDAKGQPIGRIGEEDSVIFLNFRGDRPRQLIHTLVDPNTLDGYVERYSTLELEVLNSHLDGEPENIEVEVSFERLQAIQNGEADADNAGLKVMTLPKGSIVTYKALNPEYDQFVEHFGDIEPIKDLMLASMTEYEKGLLPKNRIAFMPHILKNTIGEVLSDAGKTQLRGAETEKYSHVTFFLNGGQEVQFKGEKRVLIPSPKVATYDQKPEMSAPQLTAAFITKLIAMLPDSAVINFANPDMVGHTGVFSAVLQAIEAVDENIGMVVDAARELGMHIVITADHGNAEQMWNYRKNSPMTKHSTNPVPFIFIPNEKEIIKRGTVRGEGRLADVSPTLLDIMGFEQPKEMTGKSLLQGFEFNKDQDQKTLLIILDGVGTQSGQRR